MLKFKILVLISIKSFTCKINVVIQMRIELIEAMRIWVAIKWKYIIVWRSVNIDMTRIIPNINKKIVLNQAN